MHQSPAWPVIQQQIVARRIDLSQLNALIAMQQGDIGEKHPVLWDGPFQSAQSDAHAKINGLRQALAFGQVCLRSAKSGHPWA
jgi:hypothetical protein